MFTGIVEALGMVSGVESREGGARLRLRLPPAVGHLEVGQSLAVNGVCLTVVDFAAHEASFDLAAETLRRTTLGLLGPGAPVNLERPLAADGRFGGHFVQGHVDGVGTVARIVPEGDSRWMEVTLPPRLARYVAEKGSVAFDGVSLTVAAVEDGRCAVALIPHTLAVTTLGRKNPGDPVNVEVDILARYLARLLEGGRRDPGETNEGEEKP